MKSKELKELRSETLGELEVIQKLLKLRRIVI